MIIKTLNIISFGGLRNRVIDLSDGVNVISGANESGKSSAAMFIKFIFYGLDGRKGRNALCERQRYVNRSPFSAPQTTVPNGVSSGSSPSPTDSRSENGCGSPT